MPNDHIPALKPKKTKVKTGSKIKWILLLLFLALLAVLFFRSEISRITEINFKGNVYTSEQELLKTTGLELGSQYFSVSVGSVEEKLLELEAVQLVTVDKQFPGVINITIEEHATVAYEIDSEGTLYAILGNGAMVPVNNSSIAVEKPILTQWESSNPYKVKLSEALSSIPSELTSDISEIIPSPTASFPDRIKLYTRSRFEVITAISLLSDKVEYLNQVIETEEPGRITMLEADSYVPFEPSTSEEEEVE